MPLPLVHLAIAAHLYRQHNKPLAPAFLLGSLAPDAIHMRPESTRTDKQTTHFFRPDQSVDEGQLAACLAGPYQAPLPLPLFTLGYAAHVLTDRYWTETVTVPMRPAIPPELTQAERHALYYRETAYIDWRLYTQAPWRPTIWAQLALADQIDFPPLLTAEEIDGWRVRTLHGFDQPPARQEEPRFFTPTLVADFIERAAAWLPRELAARGMAFTG